MQSQYLSNAWKITIKFKILWFFGFIVTSFGADILAGPASEFPSFTSMQSASLPPIEPTLIEKAFGYLLVGNPKLLAALAVTGLIALIVYLFLAVVAEGALAYAVANRENEDKVKFSKLFSKGLDYFWQLLTINFLLFLAYLVIILVYIIVTVFSIFISPIFVVAGLPVLLISIVSAIFLSIVNNYSKRFIVIDDMGTLSAVSSAVRLSWRNKNETLKLYFTVFGIFVASLIVAGIVTSIILIPFSYMNQSSLKDVALILLLLLPLAILLRTAGSILSVFLSSIWTLGFIDIRDSEAARSRLNYNIDQFQDNERNPIKNDELSED